MKKIGLLSDTHGWLDERVFPDFQHCDEIWHAGDFGNAQIVEALRKFKPLRGVYGNIDGQDIRTSFPEKLVWTCESIKVFMTHIGAYPPNYNSSIKKDLLAISPQLFICGHSHILKIMYDEHIQCLHMNPGAAGKQGWHKVRTLIRFSADGLNIKDCEVIELGKRG
jgi:uncharacterized protein